MKKILVSLIALGATGSAMAYQAEVGGQIETNDAQDTIILGGEYYLDGVNTQDGPLAEAAFLDQASLVRARYEDYDFADGFLIGGKYIDKASGFFAEIDAALGDIEGVTVGGGMYLTSSSTVGVKALVGEDYDQYSFLYKNLVFQNDGTYLNLELGVERSESDSNAPFVADYSNTEITAGGDYYFTKQSAVGGAIKVYTGDEDGKGLELTGSHFFTPAFMVTAGLTYTDFDVLDSDTGVIAGAKFRF